MHMCLYRRAMARAEADMALTPAGSPIPDPPYVTPPDGTLQPEDDEDEEAQMLQGPVSHSLSTNRDSVYLPSMM